MTQQVNDKLVLISGKSASGKSAALRNIKNPGGVVYLNCEAGKKLPFRSKFKEFVITDPMHVFKAFEFAERQADPSGKNAKGENVPTEPVHTIVIDTLTFLMNMYESVYVLNSSNTMKAWGDYAQFFQKLMQDYVAKSTKNVIFLAHASDVVNDDSILETCVQVKGSIMKTGVEAYFSTVVMAKKVLLKDLKDNESELMEITAKDEALGYKHVFQVEPTKKTAYERIRAPMGMWDDNETFIDNDVDKLIQRLDEYYG